MKPTILEQLPVRLLDNSIIVEKTKYNQLINFEKRLHELNNNTFHTPQEKESLQREIEAINRQIDKVVYELYGLTEEEIKIWREDNSINLLRRI